jgi:hypothetical protein
VKNGRQKSCLSSKIAHGSLSIQDAAKEYGAAEFFKEKGRFFQ